MSPIHVSHRVIVVNPLTGRPPPTPPFSNHDWNTNSFWTLFPNYSHNANELYNMIMEQASYPPTYLIEIHGTHMQKRPGKDNKERVTDFLLKMNLTTYLKKGGQVRCSLYLGQSND